FPANHRRATRWHAQELRLRERRHTRLFLCAPTSRPARLRLRACLRQAPGEDAGYSARGGQSARVQMRRTMGDAGWALSCLCGAEASSARRIRAEGLEQRMSDPAILIDAAARPRLPRGVRLVHSEAPGGWVLLAPERTFQPDALAAGISQRRAREVTCGPLGDHLANTD